MAISEILSKFSLVFFQGCIRRLSESAKSRAIAIPSDLDVQVKAMFDKANLISLKTGAKWLGFSKLKREPSNVGQSCY